MDNDDIEIWFLNFDFDFLPLLVDCQWSEWSAWERCSKTCGSGQRKARRTIRQQAQNGGRSCQGSSTKSETCKTNACPSAPSQSKQSLLLIYHS